MLEENALVINEAVRIPPSELHYQFVRSSGPGGQHVNRSATQVELTFDLANSPSLTDEQKARARAALQVLRGQGGHPASGFTNFPQPVAEPSRRDRALCGTDAPRAARPQEATPHSPDGRIERTSARVQAPQKHRQARAPIHADGLNGMFWLAELARTQGAVPVLATDSRAAVGQMRRASHLQSG